MLPSFAECWRGPWGWKRQPWLITGFFLGLLPGSTGFPGAFRCFFLLSFETRNEREQWRRRVGGGAAPTPKQKALSFVLFFLSDAKDDKWKEKKKL